MDNNSFYFVNNKIIGIIFEVPYACGGYSIYEEREHINFKRRCIINDCSSSIAMLYLYAHLIIMEKSNTNTHLQTNAMR